MNLVQLHLLDDEVESRSQHRWIGPVVLLLLAGLAVGVGLLPLGVPSAVGSIAPDDYFSAHRAMYHLQKIAAVPHPAGSEALAGVRTYLGEQLVALGLTPEVQRAVGVSRPDPETGLVRAADVHNVVVRIPGMASDGVILLVGRYDSGAATPGAAAGASTATLLETLRVIATGKPLRNDVVALLTDAGPQGLRAFLTRHELGRGISLALLFEGIGTRGPAALLSTTPGNGWLVEEAAAAVPHPLFLLPLNDLAARMGGGQLALDDLAERRIPALGFTFFSGLEAHGTRLDAPEHVDLRTLQDNGSYALSLVKHFGATSLSATATGDVVAFNLSRDRVVSYDVVWNRLLLPLVTLLLAGALFLGFTRERLTVKGVLAGLIAPAASLAAAFVAVVIVEALLKAALPAAAIFLEAPYHRMLLFGAFCAVALTVVFLLDPVLKRKMGMDASDPNLTAGALGWWWVASVFTGLAIPSMSYLFVWPLLFSALALALIFLAKKESTWIRPLLLALAAVPAIVLFTPAVFLLSAATTRYGALAGLPLAAVSVGFVVLVVGPLLPQLFGNKRSWAPAVLAAVVTVGLLGAFIRESHFDATRPRPDQVAYVLDARSGQARFVSAGPALDPYTRQFFPDGSAKTAFVASPASLPGRAFDAREAPAPAVALGAPSVSVLEDSPAGDLRYLRLMVTSSRGARDVRVEVSAPGEIASAAVGGETLDLKGAPSSSHLSFLFQGLTPEGVELRLTVRSLEALPIVVTDYTNGLPELPGRTVVARTPSEMPAPFDYVDPTVVTNGVTIPKLVRAHA